MKCIVCHQGETQPGTTTLTFDRAGSTIVVRSVPAEVCENCGEAYVAEDVTASVLDFVRKARGMARREVLVQLDDDLVRRLDELAGQLGTNRSELLRRGAQAVIAAEELATADSELVAAYQRQPADPALVQSARRLAAKTAPAW